jgi:hypothetical protein
MAVEQKDMSKRMQDGLRAKWCCGLHAPASSESRRSTPANALAFETLSHFDLRFEPLMIIALADLNSNTNNQSTLLADQSAKRTIPIDRYNISGSFILTQLTSSIWIIGIITVKNICDAVLRRSGRRFRKSDCAIWWLP